MLERGIYRPEGYIEIEVEPKEQGIIIFGIDFSRPIK